MNEQTGRTPDGQDQPKYRDPRGDFWRERFDSGKPYDTYLRESDPERAKRWIALADSLPPLTQDQIDRLKGHGRRLRILFHSGVWCGDCVRQGPIVERIARACGDGVEVRFHERGTSPRLDEELRVLGGLRVPVVVFLSEDFFEIARFGDRTLSTYRAKARREVGPACYAGLLPPPPDELAVEIEEWVGIFERVLLMLRLSPMLRGRHGD